jgi:hypothetical protein
VVSPATLPAGRQNKAATIQFKTDEEEKIRRTGSRRNQLAAENIFPLIQLNCGAIVDFGRYCMKFHHSSAPGKTNAKISSIRDTSGRDDFST